MYEDRREKFIYRGRRIRSLCSLKKIKGPSRRTALQKSQGLFSKPTDHETHSNYARSEIAQECTASENFPSVKFCEIPVWTLSVGLGKQRQLVHSSWRCPFQNLCSQFLFSNCRRNGEFFPNCMGAVERIIFLLIKWKFSNR